MIPDGKQATAGPARRVCTGRDQSTGRFQRCAHCARIVIVRSTACGWNRRQPQCFRVKRDRLDAGRSIELQPVHSARERDARCDSPSTDERSPRFLAVANASMMSKATSESVSTCNVF